MLERAQEIDDRETKVVPFIKKYGSLQKAIDVFNRICVTVRRCACNVRR